MMMKTKNFLLTLVALTTLMASCSMEKRIYNKGYHIDWLSKKQNPAAPQQSTAELQAPVSNTPMEPMASVETVKNTDYEPVLAISNAPSEKQDLVLSTTPEYLSHSGSKAVVNKSQSSANKNEAKIATAEVKNNNRQLLKKLLRKSNDDQMVLLIVLALLLPPLAVYFYEGNDWTSRCTVNLILTLLCGLPGVIHALILILGNK